MKRKLVWLLFALYSLLMLWLLFGQRMGAGGGIGINLQPFDTIRRFLWVLENSNSTGALRHAVVNLAGNVVMFVPLGFFLPAAFRCFRRFWSCGMVALGVILTVELLQLITQLGACDVDDLILNLVGALLGYGIWLLAVKWGEKS